MKRPGIALIALALSACDSPPDADTDSGDDGADIGGKDVPAFLSDASLAAVCAGEKPPKGAAKYEKKKGKASPMKLYLRKDAEGKFEFASSTVFGPWRPKSTKDTQLIACMDVKKKKKVRECKFDKEKPAKWVDQYDVTYDISVREAATGKELGKKTVEAKADAKCPTLFFFKNDREQDLAKYEPALLALAGPLQPTDAPPPKISAAELMAACDGTAVLGAAKYEKGKETKVRIFRREGEGGWTDGAFSGHFYGQPFWTVDAEKVGLVACVTATRGKKAKECEFEKGGKIDLVDATYTITLVEAATGKKVDEKKFDEKSETRCPFVWTFKEGEENVFLASPKDAAKSWLKSHAAP